MRIELTLNAADRAMLERGVIAAEAQAKSLKAIADTLATNLPAIVEELKSPVDPNQIVGIGVEAK